MREWQGQVLVGRLAPGKLEAMSDADAGALLDRPPR
jgi:hypothetical protein